MLNKTFTTHIAAFITALVSLLALVAPAAQAVVAGEPVLWELNSRAELLKGEARGVSVTDTGALMLAPRFSQLFNTDASFALRRMDAARFSMMRPNWT